jgi:hypothetical protein
MEVASSSEVSVTIYQPIQQYASEDCRLVANKKVRKEEEPPKNCRWSAT